MAGLPLAGGSPRHHDPRPPREAFDLPPDQFANPEALVVLNRDTGGSAEFIHEHRHFVLIKDESKIKVG